MRVKARPRVEISCLVCGKKRMVRQSEIDKGQGKFCSHACSKTGKFNPWWAGGKRIANGYIRIYIPNHPYADIYGYVAEHRLVVEKNIGRYLKPNEVVHHINHDRSNNDLNNLRLLSSQSEHLSIHARGNSHWLGKKHKPETIEKMALARREYWRRRRMYE